MMSGLVLSNAADRLVEFSGGSQLVLSKSGGEQFLTFETAVSHLVAPTNIQVDCELTQDYAQTWANKTGVTSPFYFLSRTNNIPASPPFIPNPIPKDAFQFESNGTASKAHTRWIDNAFGDLAVLYPGGNATWYGQSFAFNNGGFNPTQFSSDVSDSPGTSAFDFIPVNAISVANRVIRVYDAAANEIFAVQYDGFTYHPTGIIIGAAGTLGASDSEVLLATGTTLNLGSGVTDGSFNCAKLSSNVPNADFAVQFMLKPTVALTASNIRFLYDLRDSSDNSVITVFADNSIAFGGRNTIGGYINFVGTAPVSAGGLGFNMISTFSSNTTLLNLANSVCGSYLNPRPNSGGTTTRLMGTCVEWSISGATYSTVTNLMTGFIYRGNKATGTTWTLAQEAGVFIRGGNLKQSSKAIPTVTSMYGFYMEDYATSGSSGTYAHTNIYGAYILQQTGAQTINNGIFLAQSTVGYKAIVFRDQDSWICSDAAAELDFNSTTFKWKVGANTEATLAALSLVLRDGFVISNSANTTGLKIGAAADKLGLYSVAPVAQATVAIAAAVFVANTSGIVNDTATFDGYTIGQVVKALRNIGVLA